MVTEPESTPLPWVSDTAPLSAQYVNENHVLSDSSVCSRFTNHSANVNHVQFSEWVAAVPLPASIITAELNCTEKGTNQFMKWFRSLCLLKRFACSNDTFATDTTLLRCCFKLLQLAKHSPCIFKNYTPQKMLWILSKPSWSTLPVGISTYIILPNR